MKNVLTGLGALAIAVVVPASALAATYQYVSVNGVLKTEEAATAAQALLVSDIAPHSGVILADGSAGVDASNGTVVGTGSTNTTTSSSARSTIIMNADGSVTVIVPAGTHVHSDSDSDTGTSSNNGSCSQVITTSNDTTITSETTATGSTVHIEHDTPDTNC
jgi:hypothetical protein